MTDDQQIFEQIEKAKSILITFKRDFSGDSLTSALALQSFIKKMGKEAKVAADNFKATSSFSFLPGIADIKPEIKMGKKFIISLDTSQTAAKEISYQVKNNRLEFIITPQEGKFSQENISSKTTGYGYDLIIAVSTLDLESLGNIYHKNTEFFFDTPIINIDHHPRNEKYGQINKIKITAIATTEIIFELLKNYSIDLIDKQMATCLLTGIFSESRSFKVGSLTPNSLLVASQLITAGADKDLIVRHLYQSRNFNMLKLWGRVLAKLKNDLNGRIIWSCLNHVDFEKTSSGTEGLEDVIEELIINVPEAEIIILFINDHSDKTEIKVYTVRNIDSLFLIKEFGAEGSKNAATAVLNKPLEGTEEIIISHIKEKMKKLPL